MTFTNEQLAMQIQAGNTEPCSALWEQEKRLLYMLCYGFYSRNKDACIRAGVTLCVPRDGVDIVFDALGEFRRACKRKDAVTLL